LQLEIAPLGGVTADPDLVEKLADTPLAPAEAGSAPAASSGDTMRIATERLDELMDRVGELVIAEARLQSLALKSRDPALMSVAEDIQRLAAGLRDSTMSMRMMPISSILGRFRRLVRDLSGSLGKDIHFDVQGEETELDKTVIELLADPMVHMIRNAADHGLENAADRVAAGKSAQGTISLSASYSGAEVLIQIHDDGRGLDVKRIRERAVSRGLIAPDAQLAEADLLKLILEPGFSTAAEVTELSGRGVGMDVVRRTIEQLRGQIELSTEPGHGTTVTLRLPLTLAIIDGLLIEVGDEQFTIPLAAVEECVELPAQLAVGSAGSSFLNIRGALVPFIRLRDMFRAQQDASPFQKVVVVAASGQRIGLVVDRIVANNQTVIKQLSRLHSGVKGFSGATILGDGRVALILDVPQLVSAGRQAEDRMRKEYAA
jgi:two-component system, chemotaxis family, sensor kinase CheA